MLRWWGFLPYAVIAAVHVTALLVGADAISGPSKFALMPALLFGVLVHTRGVRPRTASAVVWLCAAILASWAGDVLLATPGDAGFLIGLGAFLGAHLAYLVLFLGPLRRRRISRVTALYIVWFVALVVVLAPHLGSLLVPVVIYGAVLGASAAAATGVSRIVAAGGLAFLISDSLLAIKLFHPVITIPAEDFVIMLFYVVAQGMLVAGSVAVLRRPGRQAMGA